MRHGSEWYKREPVAYLGGVQGMTSREHAVYSILLDLIYQHGGSVNDDPGWVAGWISDMGTAAVRRTIDGLVERGKLTREGDQLSNPRAKSEAKTKEKLRENRQKTGKKGGVSSGFSRRAKSENNNLAEAKTGHIEKRREEIEEKRDTDVSPKKIGKRLPDNWVLPKVWGQWALDEGWTEDVIRLEASKFRDYWIAVPGQKGAKRDWLATWRNWMRNCKSPRLLIGGKNGNGTGNGTGQPAFGKGDRHSAGFVEGFARSLNKWAERDLEDQRGDPGDEGSSLEAVDRRAGDDTPVALLRDVTPARGDGGGCR